VIEKWINSKFANFYTILLVKKLFYEKMFSSEKNLFEKNFFPTTCKVRFNSYPIEKIRILLNFSRTQISNIAPAFHFRAEIQVPALVVALNASA